MGSANVQHLVQNDDEIHVAYDAADRMWWAVGRLGSYGGDRQRCKAVTIALDASATAFHGRARVVMHSFYGDVQMVVTYAKQSGSSQAFQDAVP